MVEANEVQATNVEECMMLKRSHRRLISFSVLGRQDRSHQLQHQLLHLEASQEPGSIERKSMVLFFDV